MDIYTGKDTLFYNSQCLFVEYNDVLRFPTFFIIYALLENKEEFSNILDLDSFGVSSVENLVEWYWMRKHRNVLDNVDRLIESDDIETMLMDLTKNILNMNEIYTSNDTQLPFYTTLKIMNTQSNMVKRILVYTEEQNSCIEKEINNEFDGKVGYVYGDFVDVLSTVPVDSTYVFSDIEKINALKDNGKLDYSSILLADGLRYNYKIKNRKEFKVDIDTLLKSHTFKINFFENL